MNQGELTLAISKRFFLTQTESVEIIKFILSEITKDIKKGERISLRNFGSFTKEKRSSRKVRHPKTGKIITIPERVTVAFNPSAQLLQNVAEKIIAGERRKK
jgi:nucleoid DNA-binding protein